MSEKSQPKNRPAFLLWNAEESIPQGDTQE